MDNKEKTITSNLIYDGKIVKLYVDDVSTYNGLMAKREIVSHPGGVAILLVIEDKVLLERQFRYAYKEDIFEIPAGKLELNEQPMIAAMRELAEETGYHVTQLRDLGVIYPSVGYTNEKIYLFAAESGVIGKTSMDIDECIVSQFYSKEEVEQMIADGRIKDAKTICAWHRYLHIKN